VEAVAAHVRAERERVYAKLRGHPTWQPYRSHTNFLLVRTPDAERAFRHLLAQGILVRRQDHYPGLFGCIRVTVGSKEEMDAFLKAAFEVA
ncbi:aminotransferase class I/II-fold pyridoxal phosphate-dependent enzyme, partial [Acinetobacter baumannii]